jgi:4-amino-4-deoxy-L-arabinose transferase-like glycosyltransferase
MGLIVLVFWADNLASRKLAKPDEGRYAEIARNMANSGDYVTPRLNGIKYFYKPPLQYWMTALAFETHGRHEWTARWWVTFCAWLAVFAISAAAWVGLGRTTGLITGAVLVGSPYFAALAQINTLDMGVTAFTTLTLAAYWLAQVRARPTGLGEPGDRPHQGWLALAWAAAGLAVLSKGLIGILFPAATLTLYVLIHRDWRRLSTAFSWPGVAAFFAITAPWFVWVTRANPEFAHFFFIHEHFLRFLTPVSRREAPMWTFIPILLAGLLPWTTLLIPALVDACRERSPAPTFRPLTFLAIWAGFIMLFFSASSSKLPAYILPAIPAFAVLIAAAVAKRPSLSLQWHLWPAAIVAAIGIGLTLFMADRRRADPFTAGLYHQFEPWLTAMAALLLLASLMGALLARAGRKEVAVVFTSLLTLFAVQVGVRGYEILSPLQSAQRLAEVIKPKLSAQTQLFAVDMYDQTLPFYVNREWILVDYVDEFELGLKAEPQRALADVDAFVGQWVGATDAIAIMQPGLYAELQSFGVPMRQLVNDPRRVVVSRY